MHRARFAEAHLGLLRMHVDVDQARIEREPQRVRRLAVVMQHVAIGFAQRVREHAVAHVAPVDERVLARWLRVAYAGRTAKPVIGERPGARVDARGGSRRTRRPAAPRPALDGPARATGARRAPLCCSVKPTSGCASAMRRNASSQCAPLGRLGAQELAPRRRVVVELLHGHRRAGGERRGRGRSDAAAVDLDPPGVRPARPRATRAQAATPPRSTRAPRRENRASRSLRDRRRSRASTSRGARRRARNSSRSIPAPLSATRMRRMPPPARSTSICVAPESSAFSSSSFSAAAGRSTTSPAAIWLIRWSGSARICAIGHVALPRESRRPAGVHVVGDGVERRDSASRSRRMSAATCVAGDDDCGQLGRAGREPGFGERARHLDVALEADVAIVDHVRLVGVERVREHARRPGGSANAS